MNPRTVVWSNWDGAQLDATRCARWTGRRWRVRRVPWGSRYGWIAEPGQ